MKYSKYLMEEKIINTDGMTPVLAVVIAVLGVGLIGSMMPVAYVIDKTNDVWQKVTK